MRWFSWAMAGMLAGTGLACDDKNDVPPEMLGPRPAAVAPSGPTTRELLNGPKKSLRLGAFPLTLDVPKTWNLRSMAGGEVITVEGPAVSGDIVIQLVQQPQLVGVAGPETTLAQAKADMAAKPHAINRAELRPLGPGKLLEVRMISNPFENGKLPPEVWGDVEVTESRSVSFPTTRAILNPHLVKWTFTVFAPSGEKAYTVRALNFMGLGLREFEKDQEFLEQMMKTLKYEE
ncbi:MAG: hypothetical protein JWN40_5141 [Phycisphaerales bacterium]|jgi:hypothetical protein|nr:hypothetical protein [Phycisphaerales bacterium]